MVRINSSWMIILGSLVLLIVLVGMLTWNPTSHPGGADKPPLVVYCGAGIRAPVEAAAKEYEKEFGVPFQFQYGASHTLLAQVEVSKSGDVYLPGDDKYVELARGKDLIDQSAPLARMKPALAVAKGNPKKIRSLNDLLRPDVRLAQPEPEATATGQLVQGALRKSGDWERIKTNTTVFKGTVNDVATDIRVGTVDAGFVWDVLMYQYPDLESVSVPEFSDIHAGDGRHS